MSSLGSLEHPEAQEPNPEQLPFLNSDEGGNMSNVVQEERRTAGSTADKSTKLGLARNRFCGALSINLAAFLLPALYSTLSKLWVANIDPSMVVTTDVYTYMTTIAEVINEGLPRAAWSTIGDSSSRTPSQRLCLAHTLILAQTIFGLGLSLALFGAANAVSASFVPEVVRARSLAYVRISSFSALGSAMEAAVAASTRALDQPDVPLLFSSVKFIANIILDMLLISTFRVSKWEPTVNLQAGIQLACNSTAALAGLGYFMAKHSFFSKGTTTLTHTAPCLGAFRVLLRPGLLTFLESAIRNTLYLWLVRTIIAMGSIYATAWRVFNTIRWGLVMVPVQALEATTLTFVGHEWGRWRRRADTHPRASCVFSLRRIMRPAVISVVLALGFEVPVCILIAVTGARPFARWLSGSDDVAAVTERMWRTLDWCYIMYAVSTQLAAVLLATRPKWFLWQSLASNLLYVLPWAIVCQVVHLDQHNAWTYHGLVFGGSLVFSFVCVPVVLVLWALALRRAFPGTFHPVER